MLHDQARYMDDNLTVTENPLVSHPGWASTRRFLREWRVPSSVPGYYQPATMISLMLDTALGGRNDDFTAYHRTSLALHLANVLVLGLIAFAVLGSAIPAVATALLFGLHPLAVEPMAWLSERKTLLATLFAWASVWLYLANVRHRVRRILLPTLAYAVALLAKPSVVPVPLLLVVLDFWPLRRAGRAALLEKWPLFLVTLASSVVSSVSQRSAPLPHVVQLTPGHLLLESFDLLGYYTRLAFWPTHLTPLIPPPDPLTFTTPDVLLGSVGMVVLAVVLWAARRRFPAGLAGATIYFLALAPSFTILTWSSFIAYGRYLYFPSLGLLIVVGAAFAAAWNAGPRATRALVAIAAVAIFAAEAHASREALVVWRDSVSLWRHVAALAPNEPEAHNGYGIALETRGDFDAAAAEYRRSIGLANGYFFGWYNLGTLEQKRGNLDEAIRVLGRLVSFSGSSADALQALGSAELQAGRWSDAEAHLSTADRLRPGRTETLNQLGFAELQQGETEAAIATLRRSVEAHPDDAHSRLLLAVALMDSRGVTRESVELLEQASRLAAGWEKPEIALAWVLATGPDAALRDPSRARTLAETAVQRTGGKDAGALDALAAASAALGDFPKAIDAATAAAGLARAGHEDSLARAVDARVLLYRRGRAYVQADTR